MNILDQWRRLWLSRLCWVVVLLFLSLPWLCGDTTGAGEKSVPVVPAGIQAAEQGMADDVSDSGAEGVDPADKTDEDYDFLSGKGAEKDAADAGMRRYAELASRVIQLFESDKIDEERIYDTETLIARISAREIGDTVAVEFRRGTEYLDAVVVLTPLHGRRASLPEPEPEHEGEQKFEPSKLESLSGSN